MTGVSEWKDTGSLGRTGRRDEKGVSPSRSMTSWSAWSSAWGWMRSPLRAYGSGAIIVGVCYRQPNQEDGADEALYRQIGAASCSQALVLMGDLNHPDICWRDNTAGHKQSRRFLECVDDNFLLQVIEEPRRRGAMLDLVLTKEELVGNVK